MRKKRGDLGLDKHKMILPLNEDTTISKKSSASQTRRLLKKWKRNVQTDALKVTPLKPTLISQPKDDLAGWGAHEWGG